MIYPPLVPARILPFCSQREIKRILFDFTFPNSFYSEIYLSFDILELHTMIVPEASPEIIPPYFLSHRAPTDFVCSLKILETLFPFHWISRPFVIDVITESFRTAMARLGFKGAFPKIPFFIYSFPDEVNLQKTTSF